MPGLRFLTLRRETMRRFIAAVGLLALIAAPSAQAQPVLYVPSFNGPIVTRIPAPGAASTYATGLSAARGVAIDSAGNLYVADSPNSLVKVPPGGGIAQPFASGFNF